MSARLCAAALLVGAGTFRGRLMPSLVAGSPRGVAAAPARPLLEVDRATRTVRLTLVANAGQTGMLSFNGGSEGRHTVVVPRGWTVRATMINRDPETQHSALVLKQASALPLTPQAPAFAGARTTHLMPGVVTGRQESLRFIAAREGHYLIACGMTGHAQAGMWIRLEIASPSTTPVYRREPRTRVSP